MEKESADKKLDREILADANAQAERNIKKAEREAEVKRMFEAGIELDEARQEHAQAEAELSDRAQAEHQAREHQENVRQDAKSAHQKRSELELALSLARETLTRHRSSLLDIEQAIAEIRGDSAPTSGDVPESLF